MAARITNAQVMAALVALDRKVAALGAPATAKAASPVGPVKFADTAFGAKVIAAQAAKVPCAIHEPTACNRRFSAKSSGGTNHEPRIV